MAFLGDIITVQSRWKVNETIETKANELRRRIGLTVTEEDEIATTMFVAVLQTEVVKEREEDQEEAFANALENCDEIVRDAIRKKDEQHWTSYSERAYQQGRKDAARVIALSFDPHHKGPASE